MKYIHKFDDLSELNNYVATDYIEPHVSLTGEDMVDYNIIDANEHEYVDLGLPSGTLWSTESCGGYKYGETTSNYDNQESTYKYYVANGQEYSKYNSIDKKSELDLEDDPAHVNWGGNWRTCSSEQLAELLEYTTWSYTGSALNYNYTLKLTADNGRFISIPLQQYSPYDFNIGTRDAVVREGVMGRYCYNPSKYYYGDSGGVMGSRVYARTCRPVIERRTPLFGGINILPMSVWSYKNPANKFELRFGKPTSRVITSYNNTYGLSTHGSAYFNFLELGTRFSSQSSNFDTTSGIIDNKNLMYGCWRIPTVEEWRTIYGYNGNRLGSTVNGMPNVLKAWINIDNTTQGLLLFPDNFYISGKALNLTSINNLTNAEFNSYLSQGCRFLGAFGSYKDGYGWGDYGTNVEYALADNSSSVNQYQRTVTYVNSSLSASNPTMVDYKQDFYTPVFLVR